MSKITTPVYTDETARETGKKLDVLAALLGSIATSQRAIAAATPGARLETDFNALRQIAASGAAPRLYPTGSQILTAYTAPDGTTCDCPWDVVQPAATAEGESGTTAPAMVLQMHAATPEEVPFSDHQAFYVAPSGGMAAGTYSVTFGFNWGKNVRLGESFHWTLTKPAPAGAMLCGFYRAPDAAPSSYQVEVYKDAYKSELLEACAVAAGAGGTSLGTFLSKESGALNSLQCAAYGNNRWAESAIRQYLNSDQPAGKWWAPQTKWDMKPACADALPGFLSHFSAAFRAALSRVKVVTGGNGVTDDGGPVVTYDKVFLPSLEELYCTPQAPVEGPYWPYWKEITGATAPQALWKTYPLRITRDLSQPTTARGVRLRSPDRGGAGGTFTVNANGGVTSGNAMNLLRAAPACKVTVLG